VRNQSRAIFIIIPCTRITATLFQQYFSAKTHAHRQKVNSDFILSFEDNISSKSNGGTECTYSYLMLPVVSRRKTTLAIAPCQLILPGYTGRFTSLDFLRLVNITLQPGETARDFVSAEDKPGMSQFLRFHRLFR
jgi:hypothetical protein